jgi:predicted amidohydrolase YtcJ
VVNEVADLAAKNGFQLCIHAIGDRANREVLNVYERVYRAHPGEKLRWRIEHAQHLNPADIPRFGKLGVIAAMQGIHCTSDGPWVTARLGAKRAAEGAYVWQSLMKSGAIVGNGTDCPVEDVDPIACFYASVSRRLEDGSVFYPDQRMSRAEALKSYTWNNAYAAFEEDVKGSLTPGKLGDVTVFSKDLMTVPDGRDPEHARGDDDRGGEDRLPHSGAAGQALNASAALGRSLTTLRAACAPRCGSGGSARGTARCAPPDAPRLRPRAGPRGARTRR